MVFRASDRTLKTEEVSAPREAAAAEAAKARESNKERVVSYARDQSKPNGTLPGSKGPAYTTSGGAKPE